MLWNIFNFVSLTSQFCEVFMSELYKRYLVEALKERINGNLKFIQVIIGPRQVGKSTAVKQFTDSLSFDVFFHSAEISLHRD